MTATNSPMKQHCPRCRMSFRVDGPPRCSDLEKLRCPDCMQRFWSCDVWVRDGLEAVVGIFPEDAT